MKTNILFPKVNQILHGGDYNPEQWLEHPEILKEDIRLMKKAGVNTATLGVFSWSVYEPEEGIYHFEWLDQVMDSLYENGIYTILATPSGARPAWMDEKYPEVMRVNQMGVRNHHGVRHNHCMSSGIYREKVKQMNRLLAKRYGNHPGLILWHISNELGGECYCEHCQKRFQEFLRTKYHNEILELNHEWWTLFWSHRYNSFEQIEPPMPGGEGSIHGLNLDWKRFTTWNMTDYLKSEIAVFKELTPKIPVTTNFMCLYKGLDYNEMAKELDIISWDSYPTWNTEEKELWETAYETAFDHSIMRSFKREKPFMLMESVPSLVNWHPYNKLKRPGIHALSSIQAVACGCDTVQYFQWRKGRGSFEQYHGAVLDHLGTSDTRVFREVEEVGIQLKRMREVQGSLVKSKVAMIFDWDSRWALDDMAGLSKDKKYPETCRELFKSFMQFGLDVDIISSEENLDSYEVVLAPMLYLLKPKTASNLKKFTERGGQLIATYLTGYVNQNTLCYLGGFPGDGLREVFGLYAEEIDTLYPSDKNTAVFEEDSKIDGTFEVRDFCEILKVEKARVLARYSSDFYEGTPVVTVNDWGKGKAYYVGARIETAGMEALLGKILSEVGITFEKLPTGVEKHVRAGENVTYEFYLNFTGEEKIIQFLGTAEELLSQTEVSDTLILKPYGMGCIKKIGG